MSRIRTIKPEFWKNERLSDLPEATHLLAAALLNYADDEGYFNANPKLIQSDCSPLREPSVSIQCSLTELSLIGYIRLGEAEDGRAYGHIVSFSEHQRINRPTPSKIKGLRIKWAGDHQQLTEDSLNAHSQLTEDSHPERKGKERNGTGNGKSDSQKVPPGFDGSDIKLLKRLEAIRAEHGPQYAPLQFTSTAKKLAQERLAEFTEDQIAITWEWILSSKHSRAIQLREGNYVTINRILGSGPNGPWIEEYFSFAFESKPSASGFSKAELDELEATRRASIAIYGK